MTKNLMLLLALAALFGLLAACGAAADVLGPAVGSAPASSVVVGPAGPAVSGDSAAASVVVASAAGVVTGASAGAAAAGFVGPAAFGFAFMDSLVASNQDVLERLRKLGLLSARMKLSPANEKLARKYRRNFWNAVDEVAEAAARASVPPLFDTSLTLAYLSGRWGAEIVGLGPEPQSKRGFLGNVIKAFRRIYEFVDLL